MAIHVQIDPLERTATLRGVHSLCAGESSEVILSGVPDADTPTLSLRVYRDASESVQVACSVRPGTDPVEEGLAPVEGRAALRRGTLDLRTSAVSEWASEDAAAAAAADEARRSGSKEPEARAAASYRRPDSAWLVVADSSRVWAACEVPFVLRPFDDALSPDPEVPLPSYAERAEAAARAAEQAAARAERAAEDAESAESVGKVGRDELFDDPDSASPKVKASLLPSYVDDVLEVAELPASGESGKLYVVTGTNAVYRWSGSSFVEVSPSRDWSGELAAKRDLTDFSVGDGWILVKPDGALVWMAGHDTDTWVGDDELEPRLNRDSGPLGEAWIFEVGPQASGERARLEIPYSAVPIDSAVVVFDLEASTSFDGVYRLVRGSRLALDTEIPVVDDAVTRTSANPVKSSGIWSAIWGALTALPTGFTALYDWVVAQLAGKRGLDDLAVYESGWVLSVPGGVTVSLVKPFPSANQWESGESVGDYAILHYPGTAQWTLLTMVQGSQTPQEVASVLVEDGDPDDVEFLDFGSGYSARFAKAAAPTSDTLAKTSQIPAVPSAAMAAPLMDGAANAGTSANYARADHVHPTDTTRASSADLRYHIAEAAVRKTLPADCFPVTFTYEGVSYSVDSLVDESEASAAGDMYIVNTGTDYSLSMVESPATGSELMSVVEVATFSSGGVFENSGIQDLLFGGVSPVANISPRLADIQVLADRTVNLIAFENDTASIDIELPEAVTVDSVRYCRDFFLDVDNSANSSDLALEFTGLGVDYAFVPLADDSISEMMTIGAGERVRLYFTETPYTAGSLPVINVARVTLGDFVTSTATQGGN